MNLQAMKFAIDALEDACGERCNAEYNPCFQREAIIALEKAIEQAQYAEQMELPEPRLTGTFSIRAGKFKCTGCTGSWTNREDAKHHSCKDYQ